MGFVVNSLRLILSLFESVQRAQDNLILARFKEDCSERRKAEGKHECSRDRNSDLKQLSRSLDSVTTEKTASTSHTVHILDEYSVNEGLFVYIVDIGSSGSSHHHWKEI